jgi:hypothetical protein
MVLAFQLANYKADGMPSFAGGKNWGFFASFGPRQAGSANHE